MTCYLIVGASKGLGYALSKALIGPQDKAYLISRKRPDICNDHSIIWLPIDLSISTEANMVLLDNIGDDAIDVLIYNAGIWEDEGFSETPITALMNILNVGLNSAICIIKLLENNLIKAKGQIIFIGSTCGLENEGASCVGYVAAKFGVRGATHALREHFRPHMVRVCCISPGSMATDIAFGEEQKALAQYKMARMPVEDIIKVVQCTISLSPASCIKEIVLPATLDTDV